MATTSCAGPRRPGVRKHLAQAHPDRLRSLLATFSEALRGAEVAARWGAITNT
jgi:hypothetical protein